MSFRVSSTLGMSLANNIFKEMSFHSLEHFVIAFLVLVTPKCRQSHNNWESLAVWDWMNPSFPSTWKVWGIPEELKLPNSFQVNYLLQGLVRYWLQTHTNFCIYQTFQKMLCKFLAKHFVQLAEQHICGQLPRHRIFEVSASPVLWDNLEH